MMIDPISAAQIGKFWLTIKSAELYPPIAISAPWPSEIWPDKPVSKTIEATAIKSIKVTAICPWL